MTAKKRAQHIRQVTDGSVSVLTDAVHDVVLALQPLDFDDRRRVLRWAADYYMIDPAKVPLP